MIALTQFIPTLRIGFLYTYWGPLVRQLYAAPPEGYHNSLSPACPQGFVLAVTTIRELLDDFKRFLRDMEVNNQRFTKLTAKGTLIHNNTLMWSLYRVHCYITLSLSLSPGPISVKSKDIQVSDIIVLDKVLYLALC